MQHIQSAGGVVINGRGQILVITNDIGTVTLPKGSVRDGEKPIDTARREILEESGVSDLKIGKELGVLVRQGYTADNPHTPSVIKHIHIFLCATDQTDLFPIEQDAAKAEWVEISEVAARLSHPEEAEFFQKHIPDFKDLLS